VTLTVNGEAREVPPVVSTIGELLDHFRIQHQAVGVLQNGAVVGRAEFPSTPVRDGDTLDIVRFVGGG
jgi:sulfur carrier protein